MCVLLLHYLLFKLFSTTLARILSESLIVFWCLLSSRTQTVSGKCSRCQHPSQSSGADTSVNPEAVSGLLALLGVSSFFSESQSDLSGIGTIKKKVFVCVLVCCCLCVCVCVCVCFRGVKFET